VSTALLWIGVAVLGGLGALARFGLDGAVTRRLGGPFPWGTLAVNAAGSFAAGLMVGAGLEGRPQALVVVGALGSFSTFSTWMLETQRLAEDGRPGLATGNVALALAAGFAAAAAGWSLGALR